MRDHCYVVKYRSSQLGRTTIDSQPSLFASLWRYKFLIAGAALLAAVIGYGFAAIQPATYQSRGLLLLNDPRTGGELANELALFWDPTRYIRNQVTVIQSPVVADRATELMVEAGFPEDDIVVGYSAAQEEDLDAVTITSTGGDADQTTAMVNAVVAAYGEVTSEQVQVAADRQLENLEATRADLSTQLDSLDEQLQEDPDNSVLQAERNSATTQLVSINTQINSLRAEVALYGTGIQLYVPPDSPGTQIAPRPARTAAIAFVLAALAAGAFAWWRSEQDQRADTKDRPRPYSVPPSLPPSPCSRPSGLGHLLQRSPIRTPQPPRRTTSACRRCRSSSGRSVASRCSSPHRPPRTARRPPPSTSPLPL